MSATPTVSPAPTTEVVPVVVKSLMEFGFFGDPLSGPTDTELSGLMTETTKFYTKVLQGAFSHLHSFQAVLVNEIFLVDTVLPVVVDFDAHATFKENGATVPSAEEMFEVMEGASYQGKRVSIPIY